jgi:predicted esterase
MEKIRVAWRRWSRGIAVIFTLLVTFALSAKEPVNVQAARREFNDAYRHEDFQRAAEIGLDLVELVPGSVEQYNLACVYALAGEPGPALYWLERAAQNGFHNLSHLESDEDLDSVRDMRSYARVLDLVAKNLLDHRRLAIRKAVSNPPLIVEPKAKGIDGPRPLIIALHGYGDRAAHYPDLWGPPAGEIGAILAVPHGTKRVGDGRGWGDVEEADAVVQLTLEYVRQRFEVDPERVVLTGFSQGGYVAMAVGARHPNLFTGVIPMAGGYVPEIDAPAPAADGDPRFYFIVGSGDRVADQVRQAASDFEAAGFEVSLRVLTGTGHTFPRRTTTELRKALRFVLGE